MENCIAEIGIRPTQRASAPFDTYKLLSWQNGTKERELQTEGKHEEKYKILSFYFTI